MAVIETKFSVGDRVWYAGTTTEQRQHPCPDCKGERKWKAASPAGDEFEFACPRCSTSYSSFDDMSLKYTAHTPAVERLTVGSIRYDSAGHCGEGGPRHEYMCRETGVGSGRIYKEQDLFETEGEALRAADMRAKLSNSQAEWIAKRFNKTLEISDYQLSSAAMKVAKDFESKARSLLYNISDLFATIEEAEDKGAIIEAIADYKRYHWEGDRNDAEAQAA
jgi:hypothetical protein